MKAHVPHILVVDDDPKVRALLRRCLEPEGYRVSEAEDGAGLRRLLEKDGIDLITLDIGLKGEDGLSIARSIRAHSQVPIIMVTGRGDTIDRVVGLEIGADDYIAKPFHVREVLARVRTVLRRTRPVAVEDRPQAGSGSNGRYLFADWVLDVPRRELTRHGQKVPLTTSEFNLLGVFVRNAKRVLSRDQLMDLTRGHEWTPLDRSIDNQVARLRKRLGCKGELIKTVRGAGYSFTGDVVEA